MTSEQRTHLEGLAQSAIQAALEYIQQLEKGNEGLKELVKEGMEMIQRQRNIIETTANVVGGIWELKDAKE